MSNVTDVYSGILNKVGDLFTNKTRIPNPYSLPDNNSNFLKDGWGIKVGSANPIQSAEYNSLSITREFTVVLTRELITTDSNTDVPDDISLKLLEDMVEATLMIYGPDRMDLESISNVAIGSQSPIEQVRSDSRKFLSLESVFLIDVNEAF